MADALRVAGLSATTADSTAATWHQLHREYAASEGSATLIVAERTSHYVQLDRPELVVQAIAEAVAGRRKD
jgi:pimeloyl-ACP methyl ester carboxylesterase